MGDWEILPINREVKNRRRREEDERGREEDNEIEGIQIGRRGKKTRKR